MRNKHFIKRCLLLAFGLLIMAYGVSLSIKAGLGTSPISSLPYTISRLSPLSVGTATIVMHCSLIFLQIILLRRNYSIIQLMQLPIALLFGYLTDFTLASIQYLTPNTYIEQWVYCLLGIVLVGVGVSCEVNSNVIPLAGEGFILAVCKTFSLPFPAIKICFDCSLVAFSCFLGFLLRGQLIGVREGTIAAALLVGFVAKHITKWIIGPLIKKLCA